MNSRERILSAINHVESKVVPVDLGSTPSSTISAIAYNKLKAHMGINKGATLVYDVVQQLAQPEDFILDAFQVDVIDVGRAFNQGKDDWYEVKLNDSSKAFYPAWFRPVKQEDGYAYLDQDGDKLAFMPDSGAFFDQTFFPYLDGYPNNFKDLGKAMDKVLWQKLASSPWDNAHKPNFFKTLRQRCLHLIETQDRALMLGAGCNLFEWGTFLRRIDNFLMDLILEPLEVERLLDALMEKHLKSLENICSSVGDLVDVVRLGDDLGTNEGPFMSPELYRKFFKPRHKILCDYIKKHSDMKVFLHSCGSIRLLLPDLIEAGFEIINPVQTSTKGMDPKELKRDFGKDLTFWGGGANTRWVLNRGTPEEVYDYTLNILDIFMPGGGYVFNTEHNIMPEVPPENIVSMFKAVKDFSQT